MFGHLRKGDCNVSHANSLVWGRVHRPPEKPGSVTTTTPDAGTWPAFTLGTPDDTDNAMSATETRADEKDRSTRANDARTAAPDQTRDAEARTRRLEEIRQAVVEEWRWRDPERGE